MLQTIITALSGGALTLLINWLLTRKKTDAETDRLKIENAGKVVELWQKIADDLAAEVKELGVEVKNLRRENAKLIGELGRLEKMIKKQSA